MKFKDIFITFFFGLISICLSIMAYELYFKQANDVPKQNNIIQRNAISTKDENSLKQQEIIKQQEDLLKKQNEIISKHLNKIKQYEDILRENQNRNIIEDKNNEQGKKTDDNQLKKLNDTHNDVLMLSNIKNNSKETFKSKKIIILSDNFENSKKLIDKLIEEGFKNITYNGNIPKNCKFKSPYLYFINSDNHSIDNTKKITEYFQEFKLDKIYNMHLPSSDYSSIRNYGSKSNTSFDYLFIDAGKNK